MQEIRAGRVAGMLRPLSSAGFLGFGMTSPRVAAGLSPTPGMALWMEANVGVLDGSGNPCTNGGAVATWQDQSGNGNDLTASGAQRPTFETGVLNSKPVIRFNGSSNYLTLTTPFYPGTNWTAFHVLIKSGASNRFTCLTNLTSGDPSDFLSYSDGNVYVSNHLGYRFVAEDTTSWAIWTSVNTSDVQTLLKNNVGQTLSSLNSNPFATSWNVLGSRSSDPTFSNGDLAELIVYPSALSSGDRATTTNYLNAKYAIY